MYLVVVEAVGSRSLALIRVKYLVFPVIPAGVKLESSPKAQPGECEQLAKETRHPARSDAGLPPQETGHSRPEPESRREENHAPTALRASSPRSAAPAGVRFSCTSTRPGSRHLGGPAAERRRSDSRHLGGRAAGRHPQRSSGITRLCYHKSLSPVPTVGGREAAQVSG